MPSRDLASPGLELLQARKRPATLFNLEVGLGLPNLVAVIFNPVCLSMCLFFILTFLWLFDVFDFLLCFYMFLSSCNFLLSRRSSVPVPVAVEPCWAPLRPRPPPPP